ncbi:MAG TPA: hypothetical protein VK509_12910, partial [Polyangiales bacterium]|nr:hypothetical protein [Polyangiales bacterium]
VEEAGKRIYESAQRERSRRGMGTTATVAVLVDKVLFLAEVGDSRAYLLRGGQLKQLTKDQSLVNQLIEAGHLTEAEAEAFEHSNIILQALGTSESVQVDLTFVELRRGDRLLMCSDGLSGLVHADLLRSTLDGVKDPCECGTKLIEYAEAAGGHDNITVVVADFDGEGLTAPSDGDSFGYMQYPLPPSDDQASAFIDEDTESTFRAPAQPGEAPTAPPPAAQNRRDRDQGESLLPLTGDTGDSQGNVLWFVGGALALAAGVAIWLALEAPTDKAEQPEPSKRAATVEPAPQPVAEAEVEVKVYTDVAGAKLLVNGEDHGQLVAEQSKSLRLKPGAYRFEAQSAGGPAAVSVVTVRGDMPMDVFLQAPKVPAGGAPSPSEAGEQPPREAQSSEQAAPPPSGQAAQPPSGEAESPKPATDEATRARRAERAARRAERAAAAEAAAAQQPPSATPGATPPPAGRKPAETAAPGAATPPVEIPDNPF